MRQTLRGMSRTDCMTPCETLERLFLKRSAADGPSPPNVDSGVRYGESEKISAVRDAGGWAAAGAGVAGAGACGWLGAEASSKSSRPRTTDGTSCTGSCSGIAGGGATVAGIGGGTALGGGSGIGSGAGSGSGVCTKGVETGGGTTSG